MNAKKRLVLFWLVMVFVLGAAMQLHADMQIDIGVNVPYYVGIKVDDDGAGDTLDYLFLVPDIKLNWFYDTGLLRLGGGARLWTFIIQSAVYPIVSVEADVGPVVLSANVGGGLFLFFGLYTDLHTAAVFLPELSVAYRFSDRFSVGTGGLFLFAPEVADLSSFAYMGTIFARFTIRPD